METKEAVINCENQILDYSELKQWHIVIRESNLINVCFDLTPVERITTAAFAELLIMKSELIRAGGNLHVRGLHDYPKALCSVLKLCKVIEADNS